MHGCGNDYIYFNCFKSEIPSPQALAVSLSDRHKGIGGDGIVLMLPSDAADARMRMFNADGSEGSMCGNAIRCVAKYLFDEGIVTKNVMSVETLSGVRELCLSIDNGLVSAVRVDMGPAKLDPADIPVRLPGESVINRNVAIGCHEYEITCVSMGNPHAVVFRKDLDSLDLGELGPLFEYSGLFPDRVNTEFVDVISGNRLKMRVWERGSGETQACGTGACAAAVAAVISGFCAKNDDITVQLSGGELLIRYTDETVFMTGGAVRVFDGVIEA